ncbi:MAG TPA: carboxypeptidase-like regulatory domain-containing protein [Methanocella sp.]|jgi:type 1 fimbria pilin
MKKIILMGAVALFAIVLMILPAVAATGHLTVYGTVTDKQSNPVQWADVTLINSSLRTLGTATTDANGNFSIAVENPGDSDVVKAQVSYVHDGATYNTSIVNVRWYDPSSGIVAIDPTDTRLYNYPPGDQGYVWGVVLDSIANGKTINCIVYLKNDTETLSANTFDSGSGSFSFEVTPGDYTIYAVHDSDGNRLTSNRTAIHVYQSNDILLSAPITLIVDQTTSDRSARVLPLAAALILGVLMVFAIYAILGRKR